MPQTVEALSVDASELAQVAVLADGLPEGSPVAGFLRHLVASLQAGMDVTLLENEARLTPHEAADLLHMSRPHLVKLIHAGEVTAEQVGSHRRIPVSELLAFIERRDRAKVLIKHAYETPNIVEQAMRDSAGVLTDEDIAALNAL